MKTITRLYRYRIAGILFASVAVLIALASCGLAVLSRLDAYTNTLYRGNMSAKAEQCLNWGMPSNVAFPLTEQCPYREKWGPRRRTPSSPCRRRNCRFEDTATFIGLCRRSRSPNHFGQSGPSSLDARVQKRGRARTDPAGVLSADVNLRR